jgi:hypothetical protein
MVDTATKNSILAWATVWRLLLECEVACKVGGESHQRAIDLHKFVSILQSLNIIQAHGIRNFNSHLIRISKSMNKDANQNSDNKIKNIMEEIPNQEQPEQK